MMKMETNHELREKIERWKIKAEAFLNNNIKSFFIDINDTYYWCYITSVKEGWVEIKNFKGPRKGEDERIFWAEVVKFKEYEEEVRG